MTREQILSQGISKIPLQPCPVCNFDDAAYKRHCETAGRYAAAKELYDPVLYNNRFLGKWVVECLNCGMEVIFNNQTEEEHAECWNALPRK